MHPGCRQALARCQPTPACIKDLNRTVGATVPLMVRDDAEAKRPLQRYMAAGLDINARDTVRPDMGRQRPAKPKRSSGAPCVPA